MLVSVISNIACSLHVAGRAVTNVLRTCGPTQLLIFDFKSNKIYSNQTRKERWPLSGNVTEVLNISYKDHITN